MMLTLKIPFYIDAEISMMHMWEDMFNIAKHQQIKK
jgi:hypothetical protein